MLRSLVNSNSNVVGGRAAILNRILNPDCHLLPGILPAQERPLLGAFVFRRVLTAAVSVQSSKSTEPEFEGFSGTGTQYETAGSCIRDPAERFGPVLRNAIPTGYRTSD
jgi:hypothetical protein